MLPDEISLIWLAYFLIACWAIYGIWRNTR
jgi:hypothetical protein